MSGLETAIRNALERSERANAEARARVYQSARQALETGLRKQNIDDPEAINYQRRRLEALAAEGLIESCRDGRLRVSREGFPVLDAIVADLAA